MSSRMFAFAAAVCAVLALGAPVSSASAPPKSPAAHRPTAYKVQVRHTGWVRTAAPNAVAAKAQVAALRRTWWTTVRVHHARSGAAVIQAKMPSWHSRAVVSNPGQAQALANLGRAQGFQTRIVPVHH